MPIGKYKNFGDCIRAQGVKGKSLDSAQKICGEMEKKSRGEKMSNWRDLKFCVPIKEFTQVNDTFMIKGIAINETTTRNGVNYTAEELEKSAHSLIGKPILKDHNNSVDAIIGRVKESEFSYQNNNIAFSGFIKNKDMIEKVQEGLITDVSVGAFVKGLEKNEETDTVTAKGINFVELSFVAVPADPNANISFDQALENAWFIKESLNEIQMEEKMSNKKEEQKEIDIKEVLQEQSKTFNSMLKELSTVKEELKTIKAEAEEPKKEEPAPEAPQEEEKKEEPQEEPKEEPKEEPSEEEKPEEKEESKTKGKVIVNEEMQDMINIESYGNKASITLSEEAFNKYPRLSRIGDGE